MEMGNRTRRSKQLLPRTNRTESVRSESADAKTDDFTKVIFKPDFPHTSGSSFDWQSIGDVLMSEAKSAFHENNSSSVSEEQRVPSTHADDQQEKAISNACTKEKVFTACETAEYNESASNSSSEEDDIKLSSIATNQHIQFAISSPAGEGVSVVDDPNPVLALSKIFSQSPFDPHAPQLQVKLIIKSMVSLTQLSRREDNVIELEIKKSFIEEYSKNAKNNRTISPFMDFSQINVMHASDEFLTFCSCKKCLEYREIVVHIMADQFKGAHMLVMLLDVLIKNYSPMLRNVTAYNKFERLIDANKQIYWITWGFVYNKKSEHMEFIYDETLSDNMILVLFSSILMVNNPFQLLQILAFHIECVVKAYTEGFLEIVDPVNNKIPAEDMLTYIMDGYADLCRISDQISTYLFAFENNFLRKFSLTWSLLCQRLYQQHVYLGLTDTMLACIITLKEEKLTIRNASLIRRYIEFDDKMQQIEKRWIDVWFDLNKFNLSDVEQKRRKCLLDVYQIFDTVVQDARDFSLEESGDESDFYDFEALGNRRLAWHNIMAYTKMKWPDGFFQPPNTHICDDKCKKCKELLEYHAEGCKCVTCSIAGGPSPPRRNADGICYKCLAHSVVEKESQSKLLNVCTIDDSVSALKNKRKRKCPALEELDEQAAVALFSETKAGESIRDGAYHVAWAVFTHLNNRRRYRHATIAEKYFCGDCKRIACLLARKILNNEITESFARHLVHYYQPIGMTRKDLCSILPNVVQYNQKMIASNIGMNLANVHDLVVKIYWIFVISLYGSYFLDYNLNCPLQVDNLELVNNDIRIRMEVFVGSENDPPFKNFLQHLKGFSTGNFPLDMDPKDMLDIFEVSLQMRKKFNLCPNEETTPPTSEDIVEVSPVVESPPKKCAKEKTKRCCFDHPELGDHCKESHSTKKRLKKECNHARVNETRDRLRKKLSQLVNARKTIKSSVDEQTNSVNTDIQKSPSAKCVATVVEEKRASNIRADCKDDSLECLNSLCKRINNLSTSKPKTASVPVKKSSMDSTKSTISNELPTEQNSAPNTNNNCQVADKSNGCNVKPSNRTNTLTKESSEMDKEIVELIDNYRKERWIKDTLTFIEGSGSGTNGKKQPQTANPKKAAKKAKQKLRKEEEKRIIELQDLRGQFQDLYFKEFVDKHQLKLLKSGKKRDKKKINELEVNVKKLQRAKSKVEASILELIATVKQTSTEFRFPYLPTKEQRAAKLQEIEVSTNATVEPAGEASAAGQLPLPLQMASNEPSKFTLLADTTDNFGTPYVHVGHFRCRMDFQAQNMLGNPSYGMLRPPLPAPICYAPPQHQQLSPEVVAAMTANSTSNSNVDPSKRIVTIRRVNFPNVAEPQVTVTAKGSSPDKDKLLYTFVNGQLVQTGTAIPTMPTMPAISMTQLPLNGTTLPPPPQPQPQPQLGKLQAQLLTIPPPPLSKSKLKKERRRVAKLAGEEVSASEKLQASCVNHAQQGKLESQLDILNACSKNNKAIHKKLPLQTEVIDDVVGNSKKCNKKTVAQPSIKSLAPNKNAPLTRANYQQQRSESTTSCSARASSSPTPLNSQTNTRDNSLSSSKPTKQNKASKGKKAELLKEKSKPVLVDKQERQATAKGVNLKKHAQTCKSEELKGASVTSARDQEADSEKPAEVQPKAKPERQRRLKVVDSGQFDNNPFKSLHMQDSDSGSEADSSSDGEAMVSTVHEQTPLAKSVPSTKVKRNSLNEAPIATVVHKSGQEKGASASQTSTKHLKRDAVTVAPKAIADVAQAQTKNSKKQQIQQKETPAAMRTRNQKSDVVVRTPKSDQRTTVHCQQTSTLSGSSRNNASEIRTNDTKNETSRTKSGRETAFSGTNENSPPSRGKQRSSACNAQRHPAVSNSAPDGKPPSKRAQKQTQRGKNKVQKQQQQQQQHSSIYNDCYGGIPNNMGYFNPNEVVIPPTPTSQYSLATQMQGLCIDDNRQYPALGYPNNSCHNFAGKKPTAANVSIMDQLNRGVQVENLSLPPGITLTKVDPIKSEQLRQKSESIKKLSQPLQAQPSVPQSFHHPGATIIAPPVGAVPNYYNAATLEQSGIIMVEANPPASKSNISSASAGAAANSKTSRNKKRRNKPNHKDAARSNNLCNGPNSMDSDDSNQSRMITLRNPMFHGSTATSILQPPNLMATGGRPPIGGGMPLPTPLPMDQPAAIIKNENGMFTIRNPALHQAVTNGLALSGYRQFGNVSYYTPQEAAAEATRATQQQKTANMKATTATAAISSPPSYSYFADTATDMATKVSSKASHNTISISCTTVDTNTDRLDSGTEVASSMQSPPVKCISAIGSEIKNAQQQKQKCIESQWSNFAADMPANMQENLGCGAGGYLGAGGNMPNATALQEKYQQSNYYNGYNVFPAKGQSSSGSYFDGGDCHMHHNCGDESPPPTITGYNAYLEGIPNTGIIRYDDASFLKNLIPGQNMSLNNEVSIHNINDSNYGRNTTSPAPHRVEITPVFANRPTSANLYEHCSTMAHEQTEQRQKLISNNPTNYRESDANIFGTNNLLQLNELDSSDPNVQNFKRFNYDYENKIEKKTSGIIDLNDLLIRRSPHNTQSTSPYVDESVMDSFVQNMNTLHISGAPNEQGSQLNGNGSADGESKKTSGTANICNGWW